MTKKETHWMAGLDRPLSRDDLFVKNAVKEDRSQFVNGVDDVVENPRIVVDDAKSQWNQFKNDARSTASYLEYLITPDPKGLY